MILYCLHIVTYTVSFRFAWSFPCNVYNTYVSCSGPSLGWDYVLIPYAQICFGQLQGSMVPNVNWGGGAEYQLMFIWF